VLLLIFAAFLSFIILGFVFFCCVRFLELVLFLIYFALFHLFSL